ncbi:helix-turn-helix transcriptional regulator [Daejeonella sp.]|jgi:transcriptional regulator with XRE-family HTH domain|uniref:helix-turn-helix transcriptional regulator n=1 Tax=Daejeonella sp. TaxID=2805397 RepID=UPI0037835516
MNAEIGQVVALLRMAHGLKQNDVSKRLEISISAYANMERGRCDLNTEKFEQIASLYKIKPHQIIMLSEALNKHKDLELIKNSISSILNGIRI